MRRFPRLVPCQIVGLLFALSACSGNADEPTASEMKAELSATFQSGADGLTKAQADCFADLIIEEAGAEALKDVDLSADTPPDELKDAVSVATERAVDECDLSPGG